MVDFPKVQYSTRLGRVDQLFPMGAEPYSSMMAYLESEDIDYVWAWTGYHVHHKEVNTVDAQYCPIDVFIQTRNQRRTHDDEYDHYIAIDIVEPSMVHNANQLKYQGTVNFPGYYV